MTEKYTPELHARLRELHQQASRTPWNIALSDGKDRPVEIVCRYGRKGTNTSFVFAPVFAPVFGTDFSPDIADVEEDVDIDTRYTVASANAIPVLLDEIERLQNELDTALPEAWKDGYADCLCDIEAFYEINREAITNKTANPYEEQK